MKRFDENNFHELTDGHYWLSQYEGQVPKIVDCWWTTKFIGKRDVMYIYVSLGYSPKDIHLIPGDPENSDDYRGLILYGPIPEVTNDELRAK